MTEPSTLVALLRSRARLHPDRVAYVFLQDGEAETARLTYRDLDERARAVAARLQEERAEPGDRALLLFPPGLEFLEAFFGCLYAGVVAVPSYPPRPGREQPRLRSIVEDSRPRFALATAGITAKAPVFSEAEPAFAGMRWIVTEEIPSEGSGTWREPEVSGETLAFLQYTSGSTADPKGVEVSHGNLLFMEDVIRRAFELDEQSVIVGWLPVYHDMGLIGNVLQPLYVGAACVLMSPVAFLRRPRRWLEAISRYRGTTGGGPNFAYELCVERIPESERAGLDLSSWRVAYNGAEPVRASTLERFAEAFAPNGFRRESFLPCYGLAEATLLVSGTVRPQGPEVVEVEDGGKTRELVSCGPVPEGMRVEVVDPVSRERVGPGQEGELWVAAGPGMPGIPRGYWNRPEVNREVFQARTADGDGPYLRTGDLGFLRGGELYVTGRLKDLIILRGRNHYPQDLELTAERCAPGLATAGAAAFSVEMDDEERLVVVQEVVPRLRPTPEQVEELAGTIRRAVAEGHEVQAWDVVVLRPGALPKTSSGKVQRQLCRRMYLEGTLESYGHSQLAEVAAPAGCGDDLDREALLALAPEDRAEALESWLRGLAARVLRVPVAELRGDRPLIELGLDSLAAIELGHAVESALGVELPVALVLEGASLRDLAEPLTPWPPLPSPPLPPGEGERFRTGVNLGGGPNAAAWGATLPALDDTVWAASPLSRAVGGRWERGPGGEGLSAGQRGLWFLHRLAPNGTAYHLAAAARIPSDVGGDISAATLRTAFQTLADRHEALRTTYAPGPDGEPVAIVHPSLPVAFEEHGADASIEETVFRPFDLQNGPVLRIDLFDRPDGRVLALAVHHMAADFWSFGVLLRELGVLLSGGDPGPAPALSYADFVLWQERRLAGEEGERLWRYWHDRLQGLPPLDLPLDRPRSADQVDASADRGGCRRSLLTGSVADRLRALAGTSGTTLFAVLLAAYQAWLHRLTGQADLAVGSPLAGRPAGLPGVGGLVGYFINPVVLRSELPGDPTFAELLAQSRSRLLQALQHGDFPLPLLVQRLRPEHQDGHLVQAMLLVHRGQPESPGLPAFALGEAGGRLSLGSLELESLPLDPRDAQFDLSLNVGEHWDGLALSLVYDAALFDATTAARWLGHFATLAEGIAADPSARISELPLLSAAERQQLAFEFNDSEASPVPAFPEVFAERARRHPERTALSFEGLRATYAGLNARADSLASHLRKLGVAPEEPVGVYLDRGPDLVASLLAVMKAGGAYVPLDPSYPVERLTYMLEDAGASLVLTREDRFDLPLPGLRPVFVEQVEDEPENLSFHPFRLEPERLAYVLYTSGSTGRPKGVQISHGALANLLRAMAERPGLGSSDRLLAVTPVSFDISGLELYLPLAAGAELVLVGRETAVDGHRLLAALEDSRATVLQATPATWRLLLAAGWEARPAGEPGLRVWCGGEALPPELAAELARRGSEVWNLYGPTETTIWSAAARVEAGQPVFLGQPVSDTWIHVVDRGLQPVPAGAVGELVLGGSGLARGYRNRPDVTAERFVPDPFAQVLGRPGARLYRTGDLARRKASGELEFLGRIDHQVKVRGYRIELGEIEAVLARHPGVREAVVVAREAHAGERLLAAFWTGDGVSGAELREHLRAHLPEYMVPSSFQLLEALPLTPNGKVDRKALLRLEIVEGADPAADHEPPRGELEETLAQIWRSVLPPSVAQGAHGPGRQDHFFHLGGHSLLATQVVSRLRTLLGVEVPLRALFEAPTLAAFADRVRRQMRHPEGTSGPEGAAGMPPLTAAPELRGQPAPLSFAQQRLWFLDQLERGTAAYNIPAAFRLQGRLDPAALESAFGEIVRRHDALRTTFHALGEEPVQTVAEPAAFVLPLVDLSGLASPEREGERLLESEARRPFDLERGPLFRPVLIRLEAEEHLLSATIHHIVSDGWSGGVLIRELIALYRNGELPELPIQYADFARWQRRWLATGEALGAELAFWREQLRDLPARLDLPTDRPRVPIQAPRGVRLPAGIGTETARRLRALARAEGATLFMVLLAGFQALLSRLSGQLDLAVGSPVAGRTRVELEVLIGFFVNTLVIRGDLSGDPDVRTLIARVRERTLAAQAHQELPFERLVEELQPERSLGFTPFFQVMFVFQNTPPEDLSLPGIRTAPVPVDTGTAKFDLLLSLEEGPGGPGEALTGWLELNADLFDPPTVRRLLEQLEGLLAAAAERPEARIADLPLLPEWERHQVLAEANDRPEVAVPWGTLHEAFEREAARTPDALAVVDGHGRLSYGELDRRANALARHLRAQGAGPESVVGVGLPRTADLPVALLAILKSGAAYLPLDPGYPADRIAFMLEDSGAAAVVTREGLLPVPAGAREILLDRHAAEIAGRDGAPLEPTGTSRNLAYVIYTSGSTGRPKGVAIEHGSAVRLAAWAGTLHGPDELARVLAATSVNFDLSVYELFVPLAFGGAVVLAADALALPTLPAAQEVTLINTVPSAIAALLDMGPLPASVRTVNLAGEPLRRALVDRLYAPGSASSLRRVWNLYGPTEDTTYSTFALARRGEGAEPTIGQPVSGSQAYILDRELRPQPLGVPGELALGGGGLARGYLGRPALTAERFIPDPFGREAGGRLYRTGDLARLRVDGEIEYLGRIDHQVKIRGFRIELGEIESALARQPAVREAAVLALPDADGGRRLVAYVSPRSEADSRVQEGAAAELVASWGALYDEIYQRSTRRSDPRFDVECWQSSYTGNPLPENEMREWVDRTVERILALRPRRVLEVGCGTGLLLYRIAPHVERYRGTDLSATAIEAIRGQLAGEDLDGVSVACTPADDWSGVQPGEQDLVVLSSVAQYFPGPGYLARFVADAVRAVEPAGAVFLGDLRSLPLREAFHASVEMFHLAGAPGTLPLAELRERVRRRMAGEEELAVDPSFFRTLARELPAVRRVRILLKRGRHLNELTRYRYDVVLEVGAPTERVSEPARPLAEPSLAALEARLAAGEETLILEDVPNARLAEDRALLERLHDPQGGTLGELRQLLAGSPGSGLDPEELWELADRFGYEAEIGWGASPWTFSAVIHRPGVAASSPGPGLAPGPLEALANDPLGSRASRQARARLAPELRRALEAELPDYMLPAAFVVLDELPHTPNGKIDRLALARILPKSETREDQVPVAQALPQGPVEEMLAGIWSELLWVESVGRDDNFFDLGGHSLLGTRVVARVREALGIELPLTAVFEAPTLAGLARRVEEERPGPNSFASGPIPRVPRGRPLPLSFAQRRLWFLDRLQPGQAAYNMPLEVRLAGRLEVAALAIALSGIVQRHEGLRAAFVVEGEEPAQFFPPPASVPLPVVDLAALPPEEGAGEARRLSRAEARRPFDLTRGPLLRATLLRLGDGDHRLLLTLHHIVADGWSLEVLFRDLAALYAGAPLPDLPIQPADYAVWEEAFLSGERLAPQLAYWERQLAGVPVLELPADRPRPAVRTLRGAVREGSLSPERVRDLAALARRERVTPFTVLLAAFQALLFRYSGQGDLAVGSPVANRGRAELEPLIGLFVNTLVLRTRLAGDLPFRELLSRVRQTVLEAFRNSDLPFERLVEHLNPERSLSHNPLFQTTFALQQVRSRGVDLPGLTLEPAGAETGAVKFDLSLSVLDWGEPGGRWGMTLEYSSDLFDGATAERLLRHFEILLAGAATGVEEPVGRLPLLDEAERFQVLGPWSDGGPGVEEAVPAHEQLAAWAATTPDAPAVLWEGGALTYGELNARAEDLAAALRDRVHPGDVVGVYAGRSPEMIVAMLAVLKTGAAYAPLDPAWPRERVAFAVEDAAMPVLLAHADLAAGLEVAAEVVVLEAPSPTLPRFAGEGAPTPAGDDQTSNAAPPVLGRADGALSRASARGRVGEGASSALAYVIYTSGSTGTPKGVAVPHSGLANLIAWHRSAFAVTPADRATQIAGVAFDASVWEIWPYLASGASVHLVSEDVRLAPSRLVRWLAEKQVTVAFLPTPLAELALDEPWPAPLALRVLLTGGDRLRRHPPAGLPFALVNCYGPTEGTVVATSGSVEPAGAGLPPIGRPISGVRTLVLDRELQPVPPGVPGELFVGGAGLAQGYLRRPDLTAASFVPDPFAAQPGERLYRTGDLVRFLADGRIEFLRRLDDQVKVKGFRIELGEIEAALGEHPGVRDAVVVARADPRGETRLVAYGVASQEPPAGELRAFLSRRLPEYMVPSIFLFLDALPLTPNGKVDRAALPAPDWQRPEIQGGYEAPRTPVEEILAAVWAELLGLDPARVGIHDNFFELGGHSLKAGQLVLRVRDTFGVELPVRTVFEAPSVATMAVAIGRKLVEQADPELLAQVLSEMQGV